MNPEDPYAVNASGRKMLAYKICTACDAPHYYPRGVCPFCLCTKTEWRESTGLGSIYSYSVTATKSEPHIDAFVTLPEGFTMLSNIIDADPEGLFIGMPVELVFRFDSDGKAQPVFRPTHKEIGDA